MGCRVIGIAGGAKKCSYVIDQLGFDACVDYKKHRISRARLPPPVRAPREIDD
jgi:NADPH-dependent curcumin reductase CurA